MKLRVVIALILLFTLVTPFFIAKDCHPAPGIWLWVGDWKRPPRCIKSPKKYARVVILRFNEDGTFTTIQADLSVYHRKAWLNTRSDGFAIFRGNWHYECGKLVVNYKMVDYDIEFSGYKEARTKEILALPECKGNKLVFNVFLREIDGERSFEQCEFKPLSDYPFILEEE